MKTTLAAVLVSAAFIPSVLSLPAASEEKKDDSRAETLFSFFSKMEGSWSCKGEFSNGKPIAADLDLTLSENGRLLHYKHIDHPPNKYRAIGQWSYFNDVDKMIASHYMSFGDTANVSVYTGTEWTDTKLTFSAEAFQTKLWAENRFTYEVQSKDKMKMLWEVNSKGTWKMGDYINCHRK